MSHEIVKDTWNYANNPKCLSLQNCHKILLSIPNCPKSVVNFQNISQCGRNFWISKNPHTLFSHSKLEWNSDYLQLRAEDACHFLKHVQTLLYVIHVALFFLHFM
jgi:hypothetical protein